MESERERERERTLVVCKERNDIEYKYYLTTYFENEGGELVEKEMIYIKIVNMFINNNSNDINNNNMRIYIYIYIYIYTYIHTHTHTYIHICIYHMI